jgi:hypothetical protein
MKTTVAFLVLLFASTAAFGGGLPTTAPRKPVPAKAAPAKPVPVKAAPAPLYPAPPLFNADYTVHADGFKVGEMSRSLKALGNDTYLIETRLHTTGVVSLFKPDEYVERSVLRVTTRGYQPLEFSSRYTGRSKDVVESMRFDWETLRGRSLRDNQEREFALTPGVLDKLMYQVAMQYDLGRGATEFRYRVADRGKIQRYNMDVVGEETLDTALGKQRTIKVQKGTTMIWCAVDLQYVPVKLEQDENGHLLTSYIVAFRRDEPPPPEPAASTR